MFANNLRRLFYTKNIAKEMLYAPNIMAAKLSTEVHYETLKVTAPKEFVYHVELHRPHQLNAMNNAMWVEIGKCFNQLSADENCRVIILSGSGKVFTAGLDLKQAAEVGAEIANADDAARRAKIISKYITTYQNSISSLETCSKPVLVAIHSACVGGGINIITAADMRYCSKDAWFQVKEVDIGMAADVGVLQRLPKVIGNDSLARELCYTARKLDSHEAEKIGLVSNVFEDKEKMMAAVTEIAENIANKSPVAVQATKASLVYSRDHTVQEGLDHIKLWNQLNLQSEDFANATVGAVTKQKDIVFSKL